MSQAVAVRLPRIRRLHFRPPSAWTIFLALYGLTCLINIFRDVLSVLEGNWLMAGPLMLWITLTFWTRRLYRFNRRLEEMTGLPMRPPLTIQWVGLGAIWLIDFWTWFVI